MNKREMKRLIAQAGGPRKVSTATGVSTQAVYQWLKGRRPIPAKRAEALRGLTKVAA